MSYLISAAKPPKPLRLGVRVALALLSIASVLTAIITSPMVMLVVGMSFDASSEWDWGHLPIVAFPVLLLSLTVSAGWAAFSSRVRPLWVVAALLVADLAVLTVTFSG